MTDERVISPEEMLQLARETMRATPHPLLPWLTEEEMLAAFARPGGAEEVAKLFAERELRIFLASDGETPDDKGRMPDPYRYGFELSNWLEADEDLRAAGKGQYNAGGKRATKSERAAKRVVQAAMNLPRAKLWCMQGSERTSISEQQSLIWKYLPAELKLMNARGRTGWTKISYSADQGFASRILVLPNRSEIHFLTYNQDYKEFQGWQLGAVMNPELEEMMRTRPWLHNIGAWMDEDAPLDWVKTVMLRCATRNACWLWTFSTMEGITPAIKEVVGAGKVLKTRPAELLAQNRIHVPDCPAGHMPYVQRAATPGVSVIYFHSDLNPFPPNYENVKAFCHGKPQLDIMQDAYGYSSDTRHRAFPLFGSWNIVKVEDLPAVGTNYMLTDPAGARNWASLWVRVTPGNPGCLYIYRDWPDAQTYGAWAEPSKNPEQPDGDAGAAQKTLGLGTEAIKRTWIELETVGGVERGTGGVERDPHRVALGVGKREEIAERFIDPRAGKNPHTEKQGGTCLVDELAKGEYPMEFLPASGVEKHIGITHVNELLYWRREEPLMPLVNAPRLYVSEECQQVIWALNNYTDRGGEKGGCKDFADLLRYMGLGDLEYRNPEAPVSWGPGRAY